VSSIIHPVLLTRTWTSRPRTWA